jgi:hypothetical protein
MYPCLVVVVWCLWAWVDGSAALKTSSQPLLRTPQRQRRRRTRIDFTSTTWLQQLLCPPSYPICRDDDDGDATELNVFATQWVHFWAQWIHVHWLGDAVAGECAMVCANVCQTLDTGRLGDASSLSVDVCPQVEEETTRCACRSCNVQGIVAAPTTTTPPPPTAAPSSSLRLSNATTTWCHSNATACADENDPCRGACDSSALQVCVPTTNTTSSILANAANASPGYKCACILGAVPSSSSTGMCVVTCQTPAGNPCGPGTACTNDAKVGHVCTPLYDASICPVGCPPTEECINGTCVCRSGYVREISYLPCVAV